MSKLVNEIMSKLVNEGRNDLLSAIHRHFAARLKPFGRGAPALGMEARRRNLLQRIRALELKELPPDMRFLHLPRVPFNQI